ncbi:sugar transferase, partial [candidate division KSB1 bacterium]|nr:sugar transferase [candidate division KSB1 bacterium]
SPLFCLKISMIIYLFWLPIFMFYGLYQSWYTRSRFTEFLVVFKSVSIGIFLIFIVTFDPERDLSQAPTLGRFMILSYWFLLVFCVGVGRLMLHTFQRKLLQAGIGLRNTVIVGWSAKARKLEEKIIQYPALGYRVLGFVTIETQNDVTEKHDQKILGNIENLKDIIEKNRIEEVILSLERPTQKNVLQAISHCENLPVHIKIEPDLYSIVMGQARTQQIYGFPLIEIQPQLMTPLERKIKRLLDIVVSLFAFVIFAPVFLISAILIKLDSRGPVFYKQERVGKNGKIFTIYKFRSMVQDAEKQSGPVWAEKEDPRITRVGRIIRKMRIDEFPQIINVLYGDMSLVGPRPERPFFVEQLKKEYPFYNRRLLVKPGITGWAQVKGKYDTTIEEVKTKLEFDLYYIENISLQLDIRIIVFTIFVMLRFKGQ